MCASPLGVREEYVKLLGLQMQTTEFSVGVYLWSFRWCVYLSKDEKGLQKCTLKLSESSSLRWLWQHHCQKQMSVDF